MIDPGLFENEIKRYCLILCEIEWVLSVKRYLHKNKCVNLLLIHYLEIHYKSNSFRRQLKVVNIFSNHNASILRTKGHWNCHRRIFHSSITKCGVSSWECSYLLGCLPQTTTPHYHEPLHCCLSSMRLRLCCFCDAFFICCADQRRVDLWWCLL